MANYTFLLIFTMFFACNATDAVNEDTQEVKLRVNSYTVSCTGEMEGTCLLVQEEDQIGTDEWEYFYFEDSIINFDYEPGYIYDLIVKKTTVSDPPADGSSVKYELLQILSKEKQ